MRGGNQVTTKKSTGSSAAKAKGGREPFQIVKKRSGRFAVVDRGSGKYINGAAKLEILVNKGLVKAKLAKKADEAAPEATPAT